jgi:hypothetical protein
MIKAFVRISSAEIMGEATEESMVLHGNQCPPHKEEDGF